MGMNERQSALENYDRFSYARDNGHLDFIQKANLCDNYFSGQQWDPKVRRRLERLGKPVLTMNKVLSTCATVFGEQLSNRADVTFRPGKDGTAEVATALDKVWLHIANSNDLNWLESEVAADGFIRGRGFFDIRIDFNDQFMGEVRIRHLNSKSIVIDPDADSYDPDDWKEVFVTKWLTAADVERVYGASYAKELRNRPNTAFSRTYDTVDWTPDSFAGERRDLGYYEDPDHRRMFRIIERQHKELRWVEFLVHPETGDMREVPTTWDRERVSLIMQQYGFTHYRKRKEQIKWVVSIDDMLLHDDWSPYKHFTPVPYFPYFRHGQTIGLVENMISPQDLLNKSISQELHIINTTANSGWIVKAGALANMTTQQLEERGGEDGLVLLVNGSPNDIQKIQANQVPSGMDRLSFKADEALKEVSMVSDSMRGFDRADVAAKAIQAKQMRGSVSLAKPFDNLAFTRKLVARNVLDLVQEFYTETRIINIVGRNLTDQPEQVAINQPTPEGTIVNDLTLGEYSVVINTMPARENFEQNQFQEALEMRQLGIAIPDDILIEHSHMARKSEIAKRMKEMQGQGEPSMQQQQLQELEMQIKQLQAQELQANTQVKMSKAKLDEARAQKELQGEDKSQELQLEAAKLQMEREKALMELDLKREEMQQEMEMKRKQLEQQLQLEWMKFEQQQQLERAKVQGQIAVADQKAQADMYAATQKMDVQRQISEQQMAMQSQQMEHQAALETQKAEQQYELQSQQAERSASLNEKMADRKAKTDEKLATAKAKSQQRAKEPKK